MKQRGPRSTASLTTIVPVRDRDGRAMPPAFLAPDEALLWRQYVEALPPSWFPSETHAVLAELCQTAVASQRVSAELRKIKSLVRAKSFDRFTELTRLKISYSEVIGRLSTKLRLTNQSRMSDRQAANEAQRPAIKPWEIGGDTDDGDGEPTGPVDWNTRPRLKN
jgi:hypothetical protein